MDLDANLLVNFTPIAATISAFVIAFIVVVRGIRKRWPISVNCWFCNSYTKVYRSERDWWLCPLCKQYNGFLKDGDYKYDIPEQRNKLLNNSAKLYSSPHKRVQQKRKNGLCKNCNDNEELKIMELRSIDPTRWRESEIQSFKQSLDKKYPLCKKCNSFVKKILHKQSLWLTQYKMLLFKQRPLKLITSRGAKLEKTCRIFLTLLSAAIIYYPTHQTLSIIGALIQLMVVIKVPLSRRNMDLFSFLLWVVIGVIMPLSNERLLRLRLKFIYIPFEYITGYQVITLLSTIVGFINILSKNSVTVSANIALKKLESPISNVESVHKMLNQVVNCNDKKNTILQTNRTSPVNVTHLLTSSTTFDTSSTNKSFMMTPNFRICDSQRNSLPNSSTTKIQNTRDKLLKPSPVQSNSEKDTFNDSLKSLHNLSLNTNNHKQNAKGSRVFETRTYGTSSPDLFRRSESNALRRKNILAPPKLKSVTQTSWVAGGYWQMGMDPPTLSRSSSQSSGFGSTGSNFGPSREPSVVNDVDRCSVISDVTQYCHQQRQTSVSPVNSFCQHSPTTYRVSEYTRCMRATPTNMIITPCHQTHQSPCYHNCHIGDQCVQNRSIIPRNAELPSCISHSPNILTSPVWLPALLCGSIVFNMIVFCTILLR